MVACASLGPGAGAVNGVVRASLIVHTGSDYATFIAWLRTPIVSILMVLLLAGIFYHAALGLQVVIEDYVHSALKTFALMGMRLVALD